MFNGDKTYDNQTEEIQWGQGTTYIEGNHRVTGTGHLLGLGHYIPVVMGAQSDWSSGGGLGCDGVRTKGSSWVQLEPISGTEQVREVLRAVGEVTLTGSKHGQLNGT